MVSSANCRKKECGSRNAVFRKVTPVHEPPADVPLFRVHVYREIEEVRDEHLPAAAWLGGPGVQDAQALEDQDVRLPDDRVGARDHVVGKVGIDRCLHRGLPGLQVRGWHPSDGDRSSPESPSAASDRASGVSGWGRGTRVPP